MELKKIPDFCQRVRAEIDLDAAVENMRNMKKNIPEDTQMIAVVKTDAYGHGAVQLSRVLEPLDFLWGFATATSEEAHILRVKGVKKPILILGFTFPTCFDQLVQEEVRPVVFREDVLEAMNEAAKRAGKKLKVHLKVDTGMRRIGVSPDEKGMEFVKKLLSYPNLELEGVLTHFASSDEEDKSKARKQLQRFQAFVAEIEREFNMHIPMKHCANSAAILEMPETHFEAVRAGITLYGLYPSDQVKKDTVPLKPVLSLYSQIVYIKDIQPGDEVSYGGTFVAQNPMRIATVPVGYGDGYPRGLSNKGWAMICGKKAPILGRVCMDQMMVDVTDIPQAAHGTKVCLIGEGLSAETVGDISGRFNYELVCDLGKRVPRVFYENGVLTEAQDYRMDS